MRQNKSKQSISTASSMQEENKRGGKKAKGEKSFPSYAGGYIVPCHIRIRKSCIREIHTVR